MPLLTIQNPETGDEAGKAAMWIDGNVHGNEIQAAEVCVYLAWYLLEKYGELPMVTELVDERVFYILPMVNPDGRHDWFHEPNTPHSARTGMRPTDNDRDGLAVLASETGGRAVVSIFRERALASVSCFKDMDSARSVTGVSVRRKSP